MQADGVEYPTHISTEKLQNNLKLCQNRDLLEFSELSCKHCLLRVYVERLDTKTHLVNPSFI